MISAEAAGIAAQCRHYAMCKIDYLGTGICGPGKNHHFVSYFPQGRMDIYKALSEDRIPVTEKLVHIAETCTLCGICDKQCHFITELRPMKVMTALKDYISSHINAGRPVTRIPEDHILRQFRDVVGENHASNDPAILVTYSDDPCPVSEMVMPKYIVMPGSHEETLSVIRICSKENLPLNVRGNGSSVIGLVMSEGVVIDTSRMKYLAVDTLNWRADVGAGIAAFELQAAAREKGLRASTAEPAALVCANIVCSGILSTFSHTYGTGADNYLDAKIAGYDGSEFEAGGKDSPNLYSFDKTGASSPGICTTASVKLYPVQDDETGVGIPFSSFEEAAALCRELSARRIGTSVALLGTEYLSTFISPTSALAGRAKTFFENTLGIRYLVLVIGDRYAVDSIHKMADAVIDGRLFRLLMTGLPELIEGEWLENLDHLETKEDLFRIFCKKEIYPLLEAVIDPSPEKISRSVPHDLKDFYSQLYSRPEMTDIVWLNTFRILSSRMGRFKHLVPFIGYVPLDRIDVIMEMNESFRRIGDKYGVKHDFGFLTPIDLGKRAILEYDYYVDQTDPADIERIRPAMGEAGAMVGEMQTKHHGIVWINAILNQGFSRKENFLYS